MKNIHFIYYIIFIIFSTVHFLPSDRIIRSFQVVAQLYVQYPKRLKWEVERYTGNETAPQLSSRIHSKIYWVQLKPVIINHWVTGRPIHPRSQGTLFTPGHRRPYSPQVTGDPTYPISRSDHIELSANHTSLTHDKRSYSTKHQTWETR